MSGPETLNSDSHPLQDWQILFDPIGVARRNVECLRQKQFLRGHSLLFHSAPQFFEQDALVRSVLIHQNKTARIFHPDIGLAEHADDLELLLRLVEAGASPAVSKRPSGSRALPCNVWSVYPTGVIRLR